VSTLPLATGHALARYGYVPFMLLGLNAAGVALTTPGASQYWLLAVLGGAIAVSFGVERIIPYEVGWNHDRSDTTRDRIHVTVNETLILASVAAIPLLASIIPAPGSGPAHGHSCCRSCPRS
jgi:hypothetical protein